MGSAFWIQNIFSGGSNQWIRGLFHTCHSLKNPFVCPKVSGLPLLHSYISKDEIATRKNGNIWNNWLRFLTKTLILFRWVGEKPPTSLFVGGFIFVWILIRFIYKICFFAWIPEDEPVRMTHRSCHSGTRAPGCFRFIEDDTAQFMLGLE